jgi:hypothetical protein
MSTLIAFVVSLVVIFCALNNVEAASTTRPIAYPQLVVVQPGGNALIRLRGYDMNTPNVSIYVGLVNRAVGLMCIFYIGSVAIHYCGFTVRWVVESTLTSILVVWLQPHGGLPHHHAEHRRHGVQ